MNDSLQLSLPVSLDPRPEYHRVHVSWQKGSSIPVATSTGSQCSSRLMSLRTANALLVLPPCSETVVQLQAGTEVHALVIPRSIV